MLLVVAGGRGANKQHRCINKWGAVAGIWDRKRGGNPGKGLGWEEPCTVDWREKGEEGRCWEAVTLRWESQTCISSLTTPSTLQRPHLLQRHGLSLTNSSLTCSWYLHCIQHQVDCCLSFFRP